MEEEFTLDHLHSYRYLSPEDHINLQRYSAALSVAAIETWNSQLLI